MRRSGQDGCREVDEPAIWKVKIQGHLDESWSGWLEGMVIDYKNGCTVLTGKMADQAALRGLLTKVWDLNQTLISVNRVDIKE
jgi:hypothetical protein